MPKAEITIRVRARDEFVPVDSFLTIVGNTLSMLRAIDRTVRRQAKSAEWQISAASLQSPLSLTISSDDPQSEYVVREYLGTLDAIEKSPDISKERVPFTVLERAKELVSVLNNGVAQMTFSAPHATPVQPTQRVAANVDYLTAPAYEDFSSFEGRMETLSVHGRDVFRIYDDLTGQSIACFFSPDKLDEAYGAFNKRVSVSGNAKYSRIGRPVSIRVETIRMLRGGVRLDQLTKIDITGGIPSEQYVRKVRYGE
jgi:hypothetical protein